MSIYNLLEIFEQDEVLVSRILVWIKDCIYKIYEMVSLRPFLINAIISVDRVNLNMWDNDKLFFLIYLGERVLHNDRLIDFQKMTIADKICSDVSLLKVIVIAWVIKRISEDNIRLVFDYLSEPFLTLIWEHIEEVRHIVYLNYFKNKTVMT